MDSGQSNSGDDVRGSSRKSAEEQLIAESILSVEAQLSWEFEDFICGMMEYILKRVVE